MKKITLLTAAMCLYASLFAQWSAFGTSAPNYVIGFETYDDTLLCFGFPSPNIYKWDGADWQTVPQIPPGSGGTHNLKVIDSVLYAVCYATGDSNHVYYWQNNTWVPMGGAFWKASSTLFPTLYDIIEYNNEIYVCGEFNRIGSDTVAGIARWNGTAWVKLDDGLRGGLPPYTQIIYPHQMLVYNNNLLVCGNFKFAGTDTVNGIASWDGNNWSDLGSGFDKVCYGMGLYNGDLWAGGEFTASGTNSLSCVAKWNGTSWLNPGFGFTYVQSSLNKFIHTIRQVGPDLYFAGGFNRVNGSFGTHYASNVLRYTGTAIDTMFGGTNFDSEGIYEVPGGILFGGGFSLAGNVPVTRTAVYSTLAGVDEIIPPLRFQLSTVNSTTLTIQNYAGEKGNWKLYSSDGRLAAAGILSAELYLGINSSGIYYLCIETDQGIVETHKVVLTRL